MCKNNKNVCIFFNLKKKAQKHDFYLILPGENTYFSTIIVRKKKCKHTRNKYEKILISWLLQLLMLLPKQSRRFLIILPVKYRWGATIAFILWITNISI